MKQVPHFAFVLEELEDSPIAPQLRTRAMFGSHAIYVGDRIVFILRKKQDPATLRDNGVWIASLSEHIPSLRREFPNSRPLEMFQTRKREGFSGWMNLPESEEDFEESVLRACRMVINGDPRIGKIPKSRPVKRPRR